MELPQILDAVTRLDGIGEFDISLATQPSPGIDKATTGMVVLLCNADISLYETVMRDRLLSIGRDPDDFVLNDRPWGLNVPGTPLIEHKGGYYLQCVVLVEGTSVWSIRGKIIDPSDLGLPRRYTAPVKVMAPKISSVSALSFIEPVVNSPPRLLQG